MAQENYYICAKWCTKNTVSYKARARQFIARFTHIFLNSKINLEIKSLFLYFVYFSLCKHECCFGDLYIINSFNSHCQLELITSSLLLPPLILLNIFSCLSNSIFVFDFIIIICGHPLNQVVLKFHARLW